MVEVPDEEFTILKDFNVNDIADFNWDEDPALKEKYIKIVQMWNAFGPEAEVADEGTAAPV